MSENLLSVFKKELGYVNATNQYVELSIRITEKEHSLDLRNNLQGLAQSVNLNVSTLTEDYNEMPDNNLHSINKLQDDIKAAKWLSVFLPKEKRQQIKEFETSLANMIHLIESFNKLSLPPSITILVTLGGISILLKATILSILFG